MACASALYPRSQWVTAGLATKQLRQLAIKIGKPGPARLGGRARAGPPLRPGRQTDPTRLVFGERLGGGASTRLLLEKHICDRLTVMVAHNKDSGSFLNGPWRRKVLTGFHEISGGQSPVWPQITLCVWGGKRSRATGATGESTLPVGQMRKRGGHCIRSA